MKNKVLIRLSYKEMRQVSGGKKCDYVHRFFKSFTPEQLLKIGVKVPDPQLKDHKGWPYVFWAENEN